MNKPILLLGHNGMLGQMVNKYFTKQGYNVIINPHRFNEEEKEQFNAFNQAHPEAIIINAIGKIKQKTNDVHELLYANTILPIFLYDNLLPGQLLIYPSTDCVFSGTKGMPYEVTDPLDAIDAYGWSKRLTDVALTGKKNVLIPRVSIIGPDNHVQPKGLLGWFLSQPDGTELKGFTNHYWNGITTLEWCKQMDAILKDNQAKAMAGKPFQLGTTEHYTKYQMLSLFANTFTKKVTLTPFETGQAVDRRLEPQRTVKPLEEQMQELKLYM